MRSYLILVLAVALGCTTAFVLDPSIQWPTEYHFNAEEIDLGTGVVKVFEIWYSEQHNRSRIDLYGGTTKRYYYGSSDGEDHWQAGKIYMFHPETDENDDPVTRCDQMRNYYGDQYDFLPSIYDFEFVETSEYGGKELLTYKKEDLLNENMKSEEYLYVYNEDGVGIPVQHVKKAFNLLSGSVQGHRILNYYNYNNEISLKSLEADENKCSEWAYGYNESLERLHPAIPSDVDIVFNGFKDHHMRTYQEKEHELRKQVFQRNWDIIVDHNNKNLGSRLTINKFSDRTKDELRYLTATKYDGPIRGTHPFPHSLHEVNRMVEREEVPRNYDLRTEGFVTPIRNQGECGSCWAFAAAATLEGALARRYQGRLLDLSEQSLVDCAWNYRSHGCQGTEAIDAVYKYIYEHGVPTVQEYGPYLMEDGLCHVQNSSQVYGIKGYVAVTPNSHSALKAAVYKYGPINIGVQVTEKMTQYQSGIFYDFECTPGALNHAVTLIGYGERDGDLYWVIKNSWGQDWGDDGYLLLAARENNCNAMTVPFYPLIE